MKEHDIVRTKEDVSDVKKGEKGTIVHIYRNGYMEVEFKISEGICNVITVKPNQITSDT